MQMNGVQLNVREKPVPGCLGRVANLFDLTSAVARNRLLTEKPHFSDGSTLSRSQSDVTRMSSPVADEMKDKMIVSEVTRSSSTKRSEGTPVKMLIAQELSKDLESTHNSPNLVAKLMGLDVLPGLAHVRSNSSCLLQNCYSDVPVDYWPQEDGSFDRGINCEAHQCQEHFSYKDIYEIRNSYSDTNGSRDVSPQQGRRNVNTNDKKMALIRQKFMDAKRLSTNEKLRETKEFQDALEVLSCNPDLFLKVLQEPSSLLTHHLYGGKPMETKRITVLRPCKMVGNENFPVSGNRNEKQVKKSSSGNQNPARPTRIVVLKPSSPRGSLRQTDFCEKSGDAETQEAREVAKEITQRMRENLAGLRRDESSFSKSEDDFVGNLSESEVMSPASRHCWDYVNRYSSPYSCSSLGPVSISPESSVTKEAKKRLSERWAMMSSTGTAGEYGQVQRSSSTLGEMLALSDVNPKRDQDPRVSTSCLSSSNFGDVESPRSLARSKSLPAGSALRLDVEALDTEARKQMTKSSLRGKVTSLFFPRSKKLSKEKNDKSQSQDLATPNQAEFIENKSPDVQSVNRSLWAELNDKSHQLEWLKPATMSSENQDQPSPISVLEPPFEDDISNTTSFSDPAISNQHGKQMSFPCGKSNLIDKSPIIGSVARILSWDEPCAQSATSEDGAKEDEWLSLIQSLLSLAGLQSESQLSSNLARWHSPESPLDPLLREKYINMVNNEPNQRRVRSNSWLVFDFVNSTLLDITGLGSTSTAREWASHTPGPLEEQLWARMKEWLWSGGWEVEDDGEDCEDSGNLAAEMTVRKELLRREWDGEVMLEIDVIGKEIEGRLIKELVEESIGDMHR